MTIHPAFDTLCKMGVFETEEVKKQKIGEELAKEVQARDLTLNDVKWGETDLPRASELLPMREAAAAAVGIRVLSPEELRPKFKDGQRSPAPAQFDLPGWCEVYAKHIRDPGAKDLVLKFLDLVGVCGIRLGVGPKDKVIYGDVAKLVAELQESATGAPPAEGASGSELPSPAPMAVVAAGAPNAVELDGTESKWGLKSFERLLGYRWELYKVLSAAHRAGKSRPKARDVLEVWKLNPPADVQVMPDGVKYNDRAGNPREANLKAIQQAIKGLTTEGRAV